MPAWLISEPLNLAPFGTGVVATLEPAPTWQTSQDIRTHPLRADAHVEVKQLAFLANFALALRRCCAACCGGAR